ncbi:uncharacterized protein LODBEIA_P57820 [Lodderomyces beijingensis]|uniref:Uncharacterized protein n=1 Tax=Lodderomyces beijingensis TaxID=1775926 RepID=A0ABP0ZTT3_9ASCO
MRYDTFESFGSTFTVSTPSPSRTNSASAPLVSPWRHEYVMSREFSKITYIIDESPYQNGQELTDAVRDLVSSIQVLTSLSHEDPEVKERLIFFFRGNRLNSIIDRIILHGLRNVQQLSLVNIPDALASKATLIQQIYTINVHCDYVVKPNLTMDLLELAIDKRDKSLAANLPSTTFRSPWKDIPTAILTHAPIAKETLYLIRSYLEEDRNCGRVIKYTIDDICVVLGNLCENRIVIGEEQIQEFKYDVAEIILTIVRNKLEYVNPEIFVNVKRKYSLLYPSNLLRRGDMAEQNSDYYQYELPSQQQQQQQQQEQREHQERERSLLVASLDSIGRLNPGLSGRDQSVATEEDENAEEEEEEEEEEDEENEVEEEEEENAGDDDDDDENADLDAEGSDEVLGSRFEPRKQTKKWPFKIFKGKKFTMSKDQKKSTIFKANLKTSSKATTSMKRKSRWKLLGLKSF